MINKSTDIKKTIDEEPMVISAKIPKWFFDAVEQFRFSNGLKTRSSAIGSLLIISLEGLGYVDDEKKRTILGDCCPDNPEATT